MRRYDYIPEYAKGKMLCARSDFDRMNLNAFD